MEFEPEGNGCLDVFMRLFFGVIAIISVLLALLITNESNPD